MKQSMRKKMSITKLTLARMKYIRKHYFQFVASHIASRRDILNVENMHPDTKIVEVGVEVLFKAICNAMEILPEEADKLAIEEYSIQRSVPDKYVDRLADLVELEYDTEKREGVTLEERQKAVEEYRSRRNMEISSEWDEEE